jgi:hypothetical protein
MKKRISLWIGIGTLNLLLASLSSVAATSVVQAEGNAGPNKSVEEACQVAQAVAESNAVKACSQRSEDSEVVNESFHDDASGDPHVGFRCSSKAYAICNTPYSGVWDG